MSHLKRLNDMARLLAVALPVVVIAAAVLLPNTALAELRRQFPGFSRMLSWLDHAAPSLNMDLVHVICFGALSLCVFLAWPRAAWRLKLGGLVGLAVVSELVQVWVPGRRPSWGDFSDDLTGLALGLGLWGLLALAGRLPQPTRRWAPHQADHPGPSEDDAGQTAKPHSS